MRTERDSRVYNIVMTAMMMCIVMVSILLLRVPIPFTQGYVNLSDAMVFMAVILLGIRYGAVAAGLGGMLGDLLSGFAMWAPWTFCIKGLMAVIFGLFMESVCRSISGRGEDKASSSVRRYFLAEISGMILAGVFMTAAYWFAEGVMYGNWAVAALGVPWNIGQFLVGTALAVALNTALAKTSLRSRMAYCAPARP